MSRENFTIVAIDGGAATGKSSTASAIAREMNYLHVDTGAHYRTLAFALQQSGIPPKDSDHLKEALASLALESIVEGRQAFLAVNDQRPRDEEIRSPGVNAVVALYAAIPVIRQILFKYQREQPAMARQHGFSGLVMEGRDIGSVIFPNATFRFYLHADEETRALRRKKQGQDDSIRQRDAIDTNRKAAPLKCPPGATMVDTAQHDLRGVIQLLLESILPSQD